MNFKSMGHILFLWAVMCCSVSTYADTVWIDVRSAVEHKFDSIEGDVRISHSEIVQQIHKLFPDKNTNIHVYCRSGARAGKALLALKEAGYKNVLNMGGINDARKERGLTE